MTTFFVGGCMRSGTALLANILCSDPSTNPMISEPQYLTRMVRLYAWGKQSFSAFLKDTFTTIEDFTQFNQNWIQEYLDQTRKNWSNCTHLVLKNPEMTPFFPEMYELVDDVKFLIIVRDPRDTIASIIEVARKQEKIGRSTNITDMRNDIAKLASFYKSYYERALGKQFGRIKSATLVLKYENLILHLAKNLEILANFTGLSTYYFDPNADWTRTTRNYEELRRDAFFGPWVTNLTGKPISTQGIERFRKLLTQEQTAAIERDCAGLMSEFGYQPSSSR